MTELVAFLQAELQLTISFSYDGEHLVSEIEQVNTLLPYEVFLLSLQIIFIELHFLEKLFNFLLNAMCFKNYVL